MRQRVPSRRWYSPGEAGHNRPRVLVEDDRPALAISDFSAFTQAGFDVAVCSGPSTGPGGCPLLRGQDCALLTGADVVLHGLDPRLGICAAIQQRHPGLPVLVKQSREPDGRLAATAPGCTPIDAFCSVPGQVDALRRALARRGAARN